MRFYLLRYAAHLQYRNHDRLPEAYIKNVGPK